jgi:hypothetical protein
VSGTTNFTFGTGVANPRSGSTCDACLGGRHRFLCTTSSSTCACNLCARAARGTVPLKLQTPKVKAAGTRHYGLPTSDLEAVKRLLGAGVAMTAISAEIGCTYNQVRWVKAKADATTQ